MTGSRAWIDTHRAELLRRQGLAAGLAISGLVALALGVGVVLGRLGAYRHVPELVLAGWVLAAAALGGGVWLAIRASRRARPERLAHAVEEAGGLRRGTLVSFAGSRETLGSAALAEIADRRTAAWLAEHGERALAPVRTASTRSVRRGALMAAGGLFVFLASGPATRHAGFWTPFASIARAHGPVELRVSRDVVPHGDSVRVTVVAGGRRSAALYVRAPGESWRAEGLALDTAGVAEVILGPLDADRYLRAVSGGRSSDTVHVRVAMPAFLTGLTLVARYPDYLGLPDEPLNPGPDTILVPVGTLIETEGRATVGLAAARWTGTGAAMALAVNGSAFAGAFRVRGSGRWTLEVETVDGTALEGASPELAVLAVPDSAPTVSIPVPGADTTAPVTLRQPLVVDVRDDYRVMQVELVSRRVSRLGAAGDTVREAIPLPEDGVEQAVLQWMLDLNDRGFLPGDTAYFRVRVWDNAPARQRGETREYALRLPSMRELREAARDDARALRDAADSLAERQAEVARATDELAREQRQDGRQAVSRAGDPADFQATERAGELAREQQGVMERADELRRQLRDLADAAWEAGLTDPEWHRQLEDLQRLLDQAITPEMEEAMRELQEAMERLDAPAMQQALERLREEQQRLREELERSRELFERAALEGEMTTLADDADDLAREQGDWNEAVEQGAPDSLMAAREEGLAERADSLAAQLEAVQQAAQEAGMPQEMTAAEMADAAAQQMQQAAQAAAQGDRQQARQRGEQAAGQLSPIAEQLRQQRDEMRQAWREEVLEAMDHALAETAQLAQRQDQLRQRLERGESGADVRAEQAAIRDGVDRVIARLRTASGQNALVSPRLATALGFSKLKMTRAVDNLQRANPNTRGAQNEANEALDGLNAVAHQLLRSRSDVASSESGSGLQEAMQRMAELAQQQNSLASQAGGLLPMMQQGGEMLMQQLQMMAQRQRQLADELDRMRGEGVADGVQELAEEARELARQLEQGVLDRGIVERQERLFRRLLDQGRTLRGNEQDETERLSRTAEAQERFRPDGTVPARGPRVRYPTWEELQRLSPEQRRIVLDYFRRLNERR